MQQKKQTNTKKAALTRNDIKEKIAKCKINRQRLDLRYDHCARLGLSY